MALSIVVVDPFEFAFFRAVQTSCVCDNSVFNGLLDDEVCFTGRIL